METTDVMILLIDSGFVVDRPTSKRVMEKYGGAEGIERNECRENAVTNDPFLMFWVVHRIALAIKMIPSSWSDVSFSAFLSRAYSISSRGIFKPPKLLRTMLRVNSSVA